MAELNFPKDRTELDPPGSGALQTGDEYKANGTTWIYDSVAGAWGSGGSGDSLSDLYLSKVNDDTAAGAITFEGKTTHEGGIKVDGGSPDAVGTGIYSQSGDGQNANFFIATEGQIHTSFVRDGSVTIGRSASTNVGLILEGQSTGSSSFSLSYNTSLNQRTDTDTYVGYAWSGGINSGVTVKNTSAFRVQSLAGENKGTCDNFKGFEIVGGAADWGTNTYGFYSELNAGTGTYGFYAAGNAPNYFAGLTEHASGISVTGDSSLIQITGNGTDTVLYNTSGHFRINRDGNQAMRIPDSQHMLFGNPGYRGDMNYRFGADMTSTAGEPHVCLDVAAVIQSGSAGTASAFNTKGTVVNAGANLDVLAGYYAYQPTISGTVSTSAAFYSNYNSGHNFYAAGSAPNYFKGQLEVRGSIFINNNQNFPGYNNTIVGCMIEAASGGNTSIFLSRDGAAVIRANRNSSDGSILEARKNGDQKGTIGVTNTNMTLGGLAGGPLILDEGADARLITTTEVITDASSVVQQLQPVKINGTRHGFAASALQPLFAEAVNGTAGATEAIGTLVDWDGTELETEVAEPSELTYTEEVETEGVTQMVSRTRSWTATGTRDIYQGVDQTKLIPLLTKSLQEALDKIETLETRLNDAGIA